MIYYRKCNECNKGYNGRGKMFCSVECRQRAMPPPNWRRGRKNGIYKKCLWCGKDFYVYLGNINRSKYCSRVCRGKHIGRLKGFQNGHIRNLGKGNYKKLTKNIRELAGYRVWRTNVFKRDEYTCVKCNAKNRYLNADHYPHSFAKVIVENNIKTTLQAIKCKKLWDISNGRTLCVGCHKKTSTYKKRYAQQ